MKRCPTFPTEPIAALERVLELVSEEAVAERIESILREVQVLDARMRTMSQDRETSRSNLAVMLNEAAAIYARGESLFVYARRKSETIDTLDLWQRTFAAFDFVGVHEEEVLRIARQDRDAGRSPGEADTPHPV